MKAYVFIGLALGLIEPAFSQAIIPCNPLPQSAKEAKKCLFTNILWDTNLYSFVRLKGLTGDLESCTLASGQKSYFTDIADTFESSAQSVKAKNITCTFDSKKSRYVCTLKGIPGCFIAKNQKGVTTTLSEITIDAVSGSVTKMSPLEPDEQDAI